MNRLDLWRISLTDGQLLLDGDRGIRLGVFDCWCRLQLSYR